MLNEVWEKITDIFKGTEKEKIKNTHPNKNHIKNSNKSSATGKNFVEKIQEITQQDTDNEIVEKLYPKIRSLIISRINDISNYVADAEELTQFNWEPLIASINYKKSQLIFTTYAIMYSKNGSEGNIIPYSKIYYNKCSLDKNNKGDVIAIHIPNSECENLIIDSIKCLDLRKLLALLQEIGNLEKDEFAPRHEYLPIEEWDLATKSLYIEALIVALPHQFRSAELLRLACMYNADDAILNQILSVLSLENQNDSGTSENIIINMFNRLLSEAPYPLASDVLKDIFIFDFLKQIYLVKNEDIINRSGIFNLTEDEQEQVNFITEILEIPDDFIEENKRIVEWVMQDSEGKSISVKKLNSVLKLLLEYTPYINIIGSSLVKKNQREVADMLDQNKRKEMFVNSYEKTIKKLFMLSQDNKKHCIRLKKNLSNALGEKSYSFIKNKESLDNSSI